MGILERAYVLMGKINNWEKGVGDQGEGSLLQMEALNILQSGGKCFDGAASRGF